MGNREGKKPRLYPYKGDMVSITNLLKLPECKCSRSHLTDKLKLGHKEEDIFKAANKPLPKVAGEISRRKREKLAADKITIRMAREEELKKKALKIMSVPVNEKKTQLHYMPKFSMRSKSNLGEVEQLKKNGYYDV